MLSNEKKTSERGLIDRAMNATGGPPIDYTISLSIFKKVDVMKRFIIVFFISVTIFFSCDSRKDGLEIVDRDDFKGIENLQFTGIVYSTQEVDNIIQGYHGRQIMRVNILESNIDDYDPRTKQANYYCIIKNGKAEIYAGSRIPSNKKDTAIGDTVRLDVKVRRMTFHSPSGEKAANNDIWIGPASFFDYIKEKGLQQF